MVILGYCSARRGGTQNAADLGDVADEAYHMFGLWEVNTNIFSCVSNSLNNRDVIVEFTYLDAVGFWIRTPILNLTQVNP